MGNMGYTTDMLSTDGAEEFNLTLLTGAIGFEVSQSIDTEIQSRALHIEDESGQELPSNWFDEVTWDYKGFYKQCAKELPEILSRVIEDVFGEDGPVSIGEVTEIQCRDVAGWGRETIMAPVTIDGQTLYDLAEYEGIETVDDGMGTSGFYRTAPDNYWSQVKVLQAMIEAHNNRTSHPLWLDFVEYWQDEAEEFVSFGKYEDLTLAV